MSYEQVNQVRYRSLIVSLWLGAGLMSAAAVLAWRMAVGAGWQLFAAVGLVLLCMLPVSALLRRRGDRTGLERIAFAMLIAAGVAVLLRMTWYAFSYWPAHPQIYLFRPVFHFTPYFFITTVVLLPPRSALRVCWIAWGLFAAVTVTGLYRVTGITLQREDEVVLLMWTLLANPLFLLLLHAMPRYEAALQQSSVELEQMRSRTELMEKLAISEQRFNLVVEGLQVGVWDRWMGTEEHRWWSPKFYELIGYTPGEIQPSEEALRELLHPDDRERVWTEGQRQLQDGDIMDVNFRLYTRHRGYRWFNSHAKAERDDNGRIVRLAGAIADIHEQRLASDALHQAQAELTRLAYRDTLTDLYNRRYLDEQFQRELPRAQRKKRPLSLLLLDLDHFKAYNDRNGHPAGDSCLIRTAHLVVRTINRPADIVARIGGDEFAVLLPETPQEGAQQVAGRLLDRIRSTAIEHAAAPPGIVTLSIGIATTDGTDEIGVADLFVQADRAMYEAKHRGRDGMVHYSELPGEA